MCVAIHLVLCAIHDVPYPSAAACQYVPSFVGWPIVCVTVCLVCNWVLVLVRMSHPFRQQPVKISHLSSGGPLCV